MHEHFAAPWPEPVERGNEYCGIDPVMVDADTYGCATRAKSLSPDERESLCAAARNLEAVLGQLPEDARPYFERLVQIARLTLEVRN
jgi:hypothetical protein